MTSTFRSFAKVNLALELVARRPDGFHELRTIFQTVDLADELEIELTARAGRVELEVEGADLPTGAENLAWRAARLFLDRWAPEGVGVALRLAKRIPAGAGLGGGSANAATVLLGMGQMLGTAPALDELRVAAASLGADVPFFLLGGAALGCGRGDELTPLAGPSGGESELHLALPPWPLSTAEVYRAVRLPGGERAPSAAVSAALAGRRVVRHEEWIGPNDLEEPAFAVRPEQAALYTSLVRTGARVVRMSGSGSTLFALFDDPAAARAAPGRLPPGTVWQKVSTLDRAAWRRASGLVTEGERG